MENISGPSNSSIPINFESLPPEVITNIFMEIVYGQQPSHDQEIRARNSADSPLKDKIMALSLINKTTRQQNSFQRNFIQSLAIALIQQKNYHNLQSLIEPLFQENLSISKLVTTEKFAIFEGLHFRDQEERQGFMENLIQVNDNALFIHLIKFAKTEVALNADQLIDRAFCSGNIEIFDFLLDNFPFNQSLIDHFLVDSATHGRHEFMASLLKHSQADPTCKDSEALKYAAIHDHADIIKLLLEDGRVNPLAENHYALQIAIQLGHLECVKALLEDDRINPNFDEGMPLRVAILMGHEKIVHYLLTKTNPEISLLVAIEHADLQTVELLLQPENYNLAMIAACAFDQFALVKYLLQFQGIDLTKALEIALKEGHQTISYLLLTSPHMPEEVKIQHEKHWKYYQ